MIYNKFKVGHLIKRVKQEDRPYYIPLFISKVDKYYECLGHTKVKFTMYYLDSQYSLYSDIFEEPIEV